VVSCIDQIETSTSSPRAFVLTLSLPKYLTKFLNFILLNDEKQIVPCESTAKEKNKWQEPLDEFRKGLGM